MELPFPVPCISDVLPVDEILARVDGQAWECVCFTVARIANIYTTRNGVPPC